MGERLRLDAKHAWLGPGRIARRASVVVERARVAWIGSRGEAPDVERRFEVPFLAPGFVDRHVHIGLSDPAAVLAGGVTRVRDLGWVPAQIHRIAEQSLAAGFDGPRIDCCGPMLTAPGGYPSDRAWAPAGMALELVGTDVVREAVDAVLDAGAIAVKLVLHPDAGPTLSDEELATACDAAHDRGRQVTAHVEGAGQAERALRAGVDELAHTPWTERLDDALVPALARRCAIVSTLDIHAAAGDGEALSIALDNLARFHAAGGLVRYGTDLGNAGIEPGVHVPELRHLARAGLSPEELLAAMTPGRLLAGMAADLVGLAADPREDVEVLGAVELVVRAGRVHAPRGAAPEPT